MSDSYAHLQINDIHHSLKRTVTCSQKILVSQTLRLNYDHNSQKTVTKPSTKDIKAGVQLPPWADKSGPWKVDYVQEGSKVGWALFSGRP